MMTSTGTKKGLDSTTENKDQRTYNPNEVRNDHHHAEHHEIMIEVCQGPDCKGIGGGAALLEIEELIQEGQQKGCQITRALEGGCRDFCSIGPNVHIIRRQRRKSRKSKNELVESFDHVKDVASCNSIVESAIIMTGSSRSSSSPTSQEGVLCSTSTSSMMTRRAERIRWDALKHASLTIAKCRKEMNNLDSNAASSSEKQKIVMEKKIDNWMELCNEQLTSAKKAELSASRGKTNKECGERRTDRLTKVIRHHFDNCLHFDDDDSSLDESSSSNSSNSLD